jgi:hypothetical protein
MAEEKSEKSWTGFAHGTAAAPLIKMICFVCGSENLSTEKCKVWCRDCHALIENCSGD